MADEEIQESAEQKPAAAPAETAATATAEVATDATEEPKIKVKKGKKRVDVNGRCAVKATFNNTMVSITDTRGGVIAWSSAGKAGFKGSRKSKAFAATLVAQDAARQAMSRGLREVEIRVQGAGSGRESAVRAIQSVGLNVTMIRDITPVPHNGCRAKKRRRV